MRKAKTTNNTAGIKLPAVSIPDESPLKGFPMPQEEIDRVRKMKKEKLTFSFKFFDRHHEVFNLGKTKVSWFISLLDAMKEVSDLTRNQLVVEQRNHYQCHPHKWDELDYKFNFSDEFLCQVECLQFRLSTGGGRVHGFIIGNRFYIVWLDPHHNLYASNKHGGRKFYGAPWNSYDELKHEHEQLRNDYNEALELLDKKTKPDTG